MKNIKIIIMLAVIVISISGCACEKIPEWYKEGRPVWIENYNPGVMISYSAKKHELSVRYDNFGEFETKVVDPSIVYIKNKDGKKISIVSLRKVVWIHGEKRGTVICRESEDRILVEYCSFPQIDGNPAKYKRFYFESCELYKEMTKRETELSKEPLEMEIIKTDACKKGTNVWMYGQTPGVIIGIHRQNKKIQVRYEYNGKYKHSYFREYELHVIKKEK